MTWTYAITNTRGIHVYRNELLYSQYEPSEQNTYNTTRFLYRVAESLLSNVDTTNSEKDEIIMMVSQASLDLIPP